MSKYIVAYRWKIKDTCTNYTADSRIPRLRPSPNPRVHDSIGRGQKLGGGLYAGAYNAHFRVTTITDRQMPRECATSIASCVTLKM